MTAHEVIDTIKALPPEEQAKVLDFVHSFEKGKDPGRTIDPSKFEASAARVFETHKELMHKLSQ
jgi:hypothetical protein